MATEYRHIPHGFSGNHPKRIVVHCMGEAIRYETDLIDAPAFLKQVGLSCHAMVRSDGTIIHCRQDTEGAYHAKGHNTDTLGIELLVPDAESLPRLKTRSRETWLTGEQFLSATKWVRQKMAQWDIPREQVVRHSDLDPERKWFDPGPCFPWSLFQAELAR